MKRTFILILILVLSAVLVNAQNWDFEKYPKRDIELIHLDGDIRISMDGTIEGDVLYNARVLNAETDSLILHVSGISILEVELNEVIADYRIDDDLLIIYSENELSRDDVIQIRILYDSTPRFGVHLNELGTIWTSLLPKSVQHWLPIYDHPRTVFTTELVITYPSEYQILTSGRKGNTELVSVDEATTSFVSNIPVPATGLALVMGRLDHTLSTIGSGQNGSIAAGFERRSYPQIYLHSEIEDPNLMSYFNSAVDAYRSAVEYFDDRFPYRDLNIVILNDDFGEIKQYGAGIIFVYRNRGNLDQQIQRGVIAQWIGTKLREEEWLDAEAIMLLQAIVIDELFDFDLSTETVVGPYSSLSDDELHKWINSLQDSEIVSFQNQLEVIERELYNESNSVIGWAELAGRIYAETGQPFFEGFSLGPVEPEFEQEYFYTARVDWLEAENRLEIYFEAVGDPVDELVSIQVEEVTFSESRSHEFTFTGESDGVVVNISPSVEYVKLMIQDRKDIQLSVEIPFMFWISQLRNDENIDERVEAARAISRERGNPDLQLALNDLLQTEFNPEVFAEILRAMSRLTEGASGTDERFIQYSSDQQHLLVQIASVEALAYFIDNERVIDRLRNKIIQSNNSEIRRVAIRSLAEVTDSERFSSITQNLITRDQLLNQVPFLLQLLAEKGEEERAVELSSTFITQGFPYNVRKKSLDLMLQYDESPSNWMTRLPVLFSDRNPKIRIAATNALDKLNEQQRNQIVEQIIYEEFDPRVRLLLER